MLRAYNATGTVLDILDIFSSILKTSLEVGIIVTPILQMRIRRLRELKCSNVIQLTKLQSQESKTSVSGSKTVHNEAYEDRKSQG